jgi:hypothetical protein
MNIRKRSQSTKPSSVFNLQRMISQNKAGKNITLDIQILVLIDNLNQRFALIPESPKQNWVIWDNILQLLDALDCFLYPKVICGPQEWRDVYFPMIQSFSNAKNLIHSNPDLLRRMCIARYKFYVFILGSFNYGEPIKDAVDETTETTEIDDEESVTIYRD